MRTVVALPAILFAFVTAVNAALPKNWSIVELDALQGEAKAVSDSGIVVGCSAVNGHNRAFVWSAGSTRELSPDLPSTSDSCAYAVNNAGMAAGIVDGQAAVWKDGALMRLPVAGIASGINESGIVVGYIKLTEDLTSPTHAFMWREGVLTDLHPAFARTSVPAAINEAGQVAGLVDFRAVIWENGTMRELGFTAGSVGAINDRGEVTGLRVFGDAVKSQPFIFDGTLSPLPGGAGGDLSALAITNGRRVLVNGLDDYAAVVENGERLSFEYMASIRAAGWKRLEPQAMNERGWIVGYASHDGMGRKFLVTPQDDRPGSANPLARASGRNVALIRMRRP